ncbi:MAG: class I tRNA ligase family protein [Fibrobacteres bacterium]|nr:class I tRNA ligase family protein [Fibrobacterota bacterium]
MGRHARLRAPGGRFARARRRSTSTTAPVRHGTSTTGTCWRHAQDIVPRYWSLRGRSVDRRFGWDCHGLPVEAEIQRA